MYLRGRYTASLLVLYLLLAGCSHDSQRDSQTDAGGVKPTRQVVVESVVWQQKDTVVQAVGTSRAQQTAVLYPQVSDEVTAVLFEAGDRVGQGQALVQLDDRDERLAVALAEVQVADAERLYQRYLASQGAGAVTESTLDTAKSALDQARISLQRARVSLDDHVISAPFAGVMGLTDIDPGARVTPTTPIVTIDDRTALLVTFDVPEVYHGQLKKGQAVSLSTWSANGPQYRGRIQSIGSQIDPQTRTFSVRAAVDNAHDQLRPGMSFRVKLVLGDGRYPSVPELALQWGGDGAFVWMVDDGIAKRVSATVVQRDSGRVLISAALEEGTGVVTEGMHLMREGQAVEATRREAGRGDE